MYKMKMRQQGLRDHLKPETGRRAAANIVVLVKTLPISSTEMAKRCLRQTSPHTLTWMGPNKKQEFTFDHEEFFCLTGMPIVTNCMAGYSCCLFAYGQTGRGKTHTMLGDIKLNSDGLSDNRGMTPRMLEELFSRIQQEEEQRKDKNIKVSVKCSFLEIYNEQITDLLEPTSTNLRLRDDGRKGVYVDKLTEFEIQRYLLQGVANRKVRATNMNRESSRSHSAFRCIIESRWEQDSMPNGIRFGRLTLVDLAGSESRKTSGTSHELLKEAVYINKSLTTLGLVIMKLVDVANGKSSHVPYRDSKLTHLLQNSLGGNSKTAIVATVSPSSCHAQETLRTLQFAEQALLICNTAVVNEDASGDVKALHAQIHELKEELHRLRRCSMEALELENREHCELIAQLRLQLEVLQLQNSKHLDLIVQLKLHLEQNAEKSNVQLKDSLGSTDSAIPCSRMDVGTSSSPSDNDDGKQTKACSKWEDYQVDALLEAHNRYGNSRAQILRSNLDVFKERNPTSLKDKYRNLSGR